MRTRRDARPDPEFDPICAIFYYIQTDTPLPSGKNKITGIICVDPESAKICSSTASKFTLFMYEECNKVATWAPFTTKISGTSPKNPKYS